MIQADQSMPPGGIKGVARMAAIRFQRADIKPESTRLIEGDRARLGACSSASRTESGDWGRVQN